MTMTLRERNERAEVFFNKCLDILEKKGADYNPDGEAFAGLRQEAKDLGMTEKQMLCVYMSKHWQAVKAYAKNGKVESEPIAGRLMDLANYCAIMAVIVDAERGDE